MKKFNFILLFTLLSLTNSFKAQMTTLYEFGNGTNDSILSNFWTPFGYDGSTLDSYEKSNNGLGMDVEFNFSGFPDFGMFHVIKTLPEMAKYVDLEFQVEFSLYPNQYDLGLFSFYSMAHASQPGLSGNTISIDVLSLDNIPYSNIHGDSVFIMEFWMPFPDSISININYIKISADTSTHYSTYLSVDDQNHNDFKIFSHSNSINITPSNKTSQYQTIIYNYAGQEVYRSTGINYSKIILDDKHGIYIVKVVEDNRVHTEKVLLD